jgi:hypothetical protein
MFFVARFNVIKIVDESSSIISFTNLKTTFNLKPESGCLIAIFVFKFTVKVIQLRPKIKYVFLLIIPLIIYNLNIFSCEVKKSKKQSDYVNHFITVIFNSTFQIQFQLKNFHLQ